MSGSFERSSNRFPSTPAKIQPCHRASNAAHNTGQLHFITFSCYHRLPYLEDPASKSTLEQVIEKVRRTHNLAIYAYVLMPEHVHLLPAEPTIRNLASFLRVIKGESSKLLKSTRETSIPKTGITKK